MNFEADDSSNFNPLVACWATKWLPWKIRLHQFKKHYFGNLTLIDIESVGF